jgi:peptidoglycan DL-endopeptidase LytE
MTNEQAAKVVALARTLIGTPYKYGARPEEAPEVFDCSSFTQYLFKQAGIDMPRSTIQQAECGSAVRREEIAPGDLVFVHGVQGHYNRNFPIGIGHVLLYIGAGRTIHAASRRIQEKPVIIEQGQVEEGSLDELIDKLNPLVVIKRN